MGPREAGESGAAELSAPVDPGGLPGMMEDLCRARAEASVEELVRSGRREDRDGGLSSLIIVGAAEAEECRAEQQARVAGLLVDAENDGRDE